MIGKTVSHFKILNKIDEGGMGIIYEAEDIKLGRKVALKFLSQNLLDSMEAKERFLQEARLASTLDHPNICTVYEVNETDGGELFIAMSLYKGETLKQLMAHKTLETGEALDIIIQVAGGLDHAHRSGIIHRDVKPANIFITDSGEVKILDFGLARLENQARLTKTGSTIGTAAYMAPEHVKSSSGDHRMDIWSLGVIFFEALGGVLPFKGEDMPSLLYSIANDQPGRLDEVNPDIDKVLVSIIDKCLRKQPDDRFEKISDFYDTLALYKKESEKGISRSRFSSIFLRMNRRATKRLVRVLVEAALLVVAVFLVVQFLLPALSKKSGLPDRLHVAVLPFRVDGESGMLKDLSHGLVSTLTDKLILMEKFKPSFWVLEARQIYRDRIFDYDLAEKHYGINTVVTGRLKQIDKDKIELQLSILNAETGQNVRSKKYTKELSDVVFWQDKLLEEIFVLLEFEFNNEIIQTLSDGNTALPGAYSLYLKGCGLMSGLNDLKAVDAAAEYLLKAIGQDSSFLWAHLKLAQVYDTKFKLTGGEPQWLLLAEEHCLKAIELNNKLGEPYVVLGNLHLLKKDTQKAVEAFLKALEYNQDYFYAYTRLARAYMAQKRLSDAEDAYKKMVDSRKDFSSSYHGLGLFYLQLGRFPEAIEQYIRITELIPEDVMAYSNLGGMYAMIMELEKAITMFEKAYKLKPAGEIARNLGTFYFYNKRYVDAVAIYEKFLSGGERMNAYQVRISIGECFRHIEGKEEDAKNIFNETIHYLVELSKTDTDNFSPIGYAYLGLCYAYVGEFDSAKEAVNQAVALEPHSTDSLWVSIIVHELSGQREKSLALIRTYLERYGPRIYLEKDPNLISLREDERFKDIFSGLNNN